MIRKMFVGLCISLCLAVGAVAQGSDKSGSDTSTSTQQTAGAKRPPVFSPTKDQIRQVQAILRDKKLYGAEPSGKYDDQTRAGIRTFQKGNGLKETGTLNRATLEKFGVDLTESQKKIPVNPNSFADGDGAGRSSTNDVKQDAAASAEAPTKHAPPFRANKEQITAAQKLLKKQSMYNGEETGKFSDEFREGLRKFQEAKGMKVTGTLNAATLQKMGIELTDSQKKNLGQ
jgi:peptidoglycan hydrolase-like protein with peptidoglycan-binding domain